MPHNRRKEPIETRLDGLLGSTHIAILTGRWVLSVVALLTAEAIWWLGGHSVALPMWIFHVIHAGCFAVFMILVVAYVCLRKYEAEIDKYNDTI